MKRTTYIMMTLVIGGVALIASFMAIIRLNAVECDDTWTRPVVISGDVKSYDLPLFDNITITVGFGSSSDGNRRSPYIKNGLHLEMIADGGISEPYVTVPVNISDSIGVSTDGGRLMLDIPSAHRFYEFCDSVSGRLSIHVPSNMAVNSVIYRNEVWTHFNVKSLDCANIDFYMDNNVYLYLDSCCISDASVVGTDYVDVRGSNIDLLKIWGIGCTRLVCNAGANVGMVELSGADVDYELSGVGKYIAVPDTLSKITVKQVFSRR